MPQKQPKRPFTERFLDNFDRGQLRREVQAVRPRGRGLRSKYLTWALGASLALGGIGVPLQMVREPYLPKTSELPGKPIEESLVGDLRAAHAIAKQVAGGVEAATANPIETVAEAPTKLAVVTEEAREAFFRTEVPFGSIIYREAKKNNVRPELVAAVVEAESRFKPNARSGAGAVGLMQLVPRTGRWMGARDLTNPTQNITAGTKYLKYLNERFDGNETKVIAAYNAGEGNVRRFGGVPPFRETQNYLKKVRSYEQEYKTRVESRFAEMESASAEAAVAR